MIEILATIALVGLFVYLVTSYIPMPAAFSNAIYIVAVVGLLFYLLWAFGLWHGHPRHF
jgi:hypothetical protein